MNTIQRLWVAKRHVQGTEYGEVEYLAKVIVYYPDSMAMAQLYKLELQALSHFRSHFGATLAVFDANNEGPDEDLREPMYTQTEWDNFVEMQIAPYVTIISTVEGAQTECVVYPDD